MPLQQEKLLVQECFSQLKTYWQRYKFPDEPLKDLDSNISTFSVRLTAQDIASLNSKMTEAESGIEGNSAAIDGIETKVTQQGDTLTSQGSQITQMTAAINGVSGVANDAQSKSNANATALQQTNVTVAQHGNMLTAQATQISQMTITVNGVSAEISDVSSVVNGMDAKMSAYRSIKVAVDANGRQYIAGIGLDVSNSGNASN